MMEITHIPNHGQLQTFYLGQLALRALLLDGEPWFVAKDVAQALEYSDTYEMTKRLDAGEVQNRQIAGFGNRGVNLVNESGLYSSILGSRKPEAKTFKRWVTAEVLPAIRKTGSYEKPRSEAEIVLEAMQILTAQVEAHKAELEVVRPKAEVYDKVLTTEHTFGFRDLCKSLRAIFPVTEADVKRVLREKRILTAGFRLDVYSDAIDRGFAVRRPVGKWGGKERFQVRFTQKTVEMLLDELEPLEEVA